MYDSLKKFIYIIGNSISNKFLIIKVLFFSFLLYFFEILGIGIFIPMINYFNPSVESKIKYLIPNELENYNIFILMFISILFVFILKSLMSIIHTYFLTLFWTTINQNLLINLFKKILNHPYREFVKKSNSSYLSILITEAEQFSELTKFTITFFVESIILISLFFLLIYLNFTASILVFILLSITASTVYLIFKNKLSIWGKKRQFFQDQLQNNVNGGLMNYLSIALNNSLNFFISSINDSIKSRNSYYMKLYVYESIPKSLIEVVAILILLSTYTTLKFIFNFSDANIISNMVFLVIAFSRILPSLNKILHSYNYMNFSKIVVDKLYALSVKEEKYDDSNLKIKFRNQIILKNISFDYKTKIKLINNLNFKIQIGTINGLFGDSGSGKSTVLKLIMGFLNPNNGQILIDKTNLDNINKKSYYDLFGYVEQNVRIFNSSLIENITFKKTLSNNEKLFFKKVINICQLNSLIEKNENLKLIEDGMNLSGGQIQRIGLARALFKKPKILVLDEFTSSLDIKNRNKITEIIKKINFEENLTVIIVSHDSYFESICDEKLFLN